MEIEQLIRRQQDGLDDMKELSKVIITKMAHIDRKVKAHEKEYQDMAKNANVKALTLNKLRQSSTSLTNMRGKSFGVTASASFEEQKAESEQMSAMQQADLKEERYQEVV